MSGFITKVDYSNNRQVRQSKLTSTDLSGTTIHGVDFSALTSGPDLSSVVTLSTTTGVTTTFSGDTGQTGFIFGISDMVIGTSDLVPITNLNSGTTQFGGPDYSGYVKTIIDGNVVNLVYTGISFNLIVNNINQVGGTFSGTALSTVIRYSAGTTDFTGRTIWNEVKGIQKSKRLIVTDGAFANSVLVSTGTTGDLVYMAYSSGSGTSALWSASTGTNAIVPLNSNSLASGTSAVAEGYRTTAGGVYSHAEGTLTMASGQTAHAEGYLTTAQGDNSHSEGLSTIAQGDSSHAEGNFSVASGYASHAEGNATTANGSWTHAEGQGTSAVGLSSHAEGINSTSLGSYSHAENGSKALGDYSHSEGSITTASGTFSHAEGNSSTAFGQTTHAEGQETKAVGDYSHSEGTLTTASGTYSHAEGFLSTASGHRSHAEGNVAIASGFGSHSEGTSTLASGQASHAEGLETTASGSYSHAEGDSTTAFGVCSHSEGGYTIASGTHSHSAGSATTASGIASHAGGGGTVSLGYASFGHSSGSTINGDHSSILGGIINTINAAVTGSTILGGNRITATVSDYTYVPSLNIKTVGAGPGVTTLGVDAGGNVVNIASDVSLKKNIETIIASLEKVNNLRGVTYKWIDEEKGGSQTNIGFIAQEVEIAVPELTFEKDGIKGVKYQDTVALLVEAVKELTRRIEILENEIRRG